MSIVTSDQGFQCAESTRESFPSHLAVHLALLSECFFLLLCHFYFFWENQAYNAKAKRRHLQKRATSSVLQLTASSSFSVIHASPRALGLLKLISILKPRDTDFVCQKCLSPIQSPFWSFPSFQRKINVPTASCAFIHSVSVTALYSIWSLGTEKRHNNGYCCNPTGFQMLEKTVTTFSSLNINLVNISKSVIGLSI